MDHKWWCKSRNPKTTAADCDCNGTYVSRLKAENARLREALELAMLHVDTMDVPDTRLDVINAALKETDQ